MVPPLDMLRELLDDHKAVIKSLREAHEVADEFEDIATASLLENFIDQAEKRAWFLFEASREAELDRALTGCNFHPKLPAGRGHFSGDARLCSRISPANRWNK